MILDSNTTIKYFKEIAKIPRESGHEEKIAKYLCEFAELRNLEYEKDEYNNVLIKKNNCNKTPLILQVHTDMVCEKEQNKCFDFEEDSIEVMEKKWIFTCKWNNFRCRQWYRNSTNFNNIR